MFFLLCTTTKLVPNTKKCKHFKHSKKHFHKYNEACHNKNALDNYPLNLHKVLLHNNKLLHTTQLGLCLTLHQC